MLMATSHPTDAHEVEEPSDGDGAMSAARVVSPVAAPSGGRYGEDRRFNGPGWIAVLALHGVFVAAAIFTQQDVARAAIERLQVVEVSLDQAPPPPEQVEQDAPPPQVVPQMLRPPVQLTAQVTPAEVVEVLPLPIPPVPAPPAPPAPTPAPTPAPVPPSVVSSGDLGTRMISGKPPRYPMESRRKREQGTVVLALTLGTDGLVSSIAIARSSGFERLDDAARTAVRKWRWAPTLRDGVAVIVRGTVEIPFVLQA